MSIKELSAENLKSTTFVKPAELIEREQVRQILPLEVNSYPQCCGASIVTNFYGSFYLSTDKTPSGVEKTRQSAAKQAVRDIKYRSSGLAVAIINHEQFNQGWHEALIEEGFDFVRWSTNPNEGDESAIFLYAYGSDEVDNGSSSLSDAYQFGWVIKNSK